MVDGRMGREVTLTWNGAAILGLREKDITLNGPAIDVTSNENSGWQTLLTIAGQNSIEIKGSGVEKSDTLKADWFAGNRTRAVVITYANGAIISGNFLMSAFNEKQPYKDAITFDVTLMSTGTPTFSAGAGF